MKENKINPNIQELLNGLPCMLYRCRDDDDWTMEFLSEGCEELTGYQKEELLYNKAISYATLIHKSDENAVFKSVKKAIEKKEPFNCEYQIILKDGSTKWVWEQGHGVYDKDGEVTYIEGFITDISLQKKQQKNLQEEIQKRDKELLENLSLLDEYKKAVDESAIVTKTDPSGILTYVNDEFCKISGFSKKEAIGRSHNIVRHPKNPKSLYKSIWDVLLAKKTWKGIIKNKTKAGETYYVQSTIIPILELDGSIKEFIAIRQDVTDLIKQEKKIKLQITDHLTKLPNRQKLLEDLEKDDEYKLAILNIERFKEINEYYGFEIGDKILLELASFLEHRLKDKDIQLYKLPSDEYAILAKEKIHKNSFQKLIKNIIFEIKNKSFTIEENTLHISIVAGVSMKKEHFINAEMATNYAKQTKEKFVFFDDNLQIKEQLVNNVYWTHKLKESFDNNRIKVFAQPIISNKEKSILKYECLVRIVEKDGNIISPYFFLDVAKKSGLYAKLTKTVIDQAIRYFKDKNSQFSINMTIEDILNPYTVAFLQKKLKKHKNIAKRLIIEIVEDEGIESFEEVSSFIEDMKRFGCKIAIDDFGTGYSNFNYLMRLNADFIKIDGSIIKNITHDENAKIVTELIISFAKKLNIETIAEFVHNKEVLKSVKKMGIDYSQGFYLGEPKQI